MKRLIIAFVLVVITIFLSSSINKDVTISFTGDILLDRGVRNKLEEEGYDYPYAKVKDIFKKSDIVFGNLECPLLKEGTPVLKRRNLIFKGDVQNAKALKNAGYSLLNLGNNHAIDYGGEGLLNTLETLNGMRIKAIGAGNTRKEACNPLFINKNGIRIGFLSYSIFPPEGYIYSEAKPDIARYEDKLMEENIKKAKKQCDFLILSFHWGNEYSFSPSDRQKEIAHKAIDSGCDAVIGHHPHVLQEIEEYKGKSICYSLGNFVFDKQIPSGTDETVILNLKIRRNGKADIEIIPAKIKNCQPTPVYGKEAEKILERLTKNSI